MARPTFGFDKRPEDINRNGRPPKDWTMASLIREAGEEAGETGEPRKKIIARKLAELAEKGDMQAIKEFNDRLDGKPKQNVTNVNVPVEEDKTKPPEERLKDVLERIKELQES